jgi:hypothetical protein
MVTSIPRGLRNNNPGNIQKSSTKYNGEIIPSTDKTFKQFKSMDYGYRAMFKLLDFYQTHYNIMTIRGMITRWAPPIENNTLSYINTVSARSCIGEDIRITTKNHDVMIPIVEAMSFHENGVPAVMEEVEAGWNLFMPNIFL